MSAGTGDILYMHTVIQHIMYKATASLESTFCLSVVFYFFFHNLFSTIELLQ